MRIPSSLLAVLSITAAGVFQACSSDSNDDQSGGGASGAGASGSPAMGGGGASAGSAQAGTAGTAPAGSGGGGTGGTAVTGGSGGTAGAPGTGGTAAGAPTGGSSGGESTAGTGGTSGGAGGATGGAGGVTGGEGGTMGGSAGAPTGGSGGGAHPMMNFFVTSDTAKTADFGGLEKADMRCQTLAEAVGAGNKTWRAYLSTENPVVHARDRIGEGPYYNSKGMMLAATKEELHTRKGDADLFLDEKGNKIDGQWNSAGNDNQHDIVTGTKSDGTVWAGNTCMDWTATTGMSGVGHSDGMGPGMDTGGNFGLWTGSHTGQCGNTQPGGGAGKIYCFVGP